MKRPARILLVDDEAIIREACTRILQRVGYEVSVARNGAEALKLLRRDRFDLVVLDIKMPELDGMQVMAALHREQLPVSLLVITGHGSAQTAAETQAAGALDFLNKPFTPTQLREAVAGALSIRRRAMTVEG